MNERRYTEDEVAAIFERATESQQRQPRQLSTGEGLTLAELRAIGNEVGIPAELVTQAARSLDASGRPAERRLLGLPVGVGRTIELPRRLTDDEWERLVVDLRETFDARGAMRSEGSFRQWTNGNLQALLEPTATGHRLRLRTVKGDARAYMTAGGALGTAGVISTLVASGSAVADPGSWVQMLTMLGAGAALFLAGAVRLPAWARTRRRQMEGVVNRLSQSIEASPDGIKTVPSSPSTPPVREAR